MDALRRRRPLGSGDRRRPGDRRRGRGGHPRLPRRAGGARRGAEDAAGARRRPLRAAGGGRRRRHRARSSARSSARCCTSRRFRAADLDRVVDAINARGFGLTCGLHSRIDDRVERVTAAAARRQHLRQPQPDRRHRRLAAVRRRGPVGHRPEGRRARSTCRGCNAPRAVPARARPAAPRSPHGPLAAAFAALDAGAGPARADRLAALRAALGAVRRRPRRCGGRAAAGAARPAGADRREQPAEPAPARPGALLGAGAGGGRWRRRCWRSPPATPVLAVADGAPAALAARACR